MQTNERRGVWRTGELVDTVLRHPAAHVDLQRRHVVLRAIQREGCGTRGVAAAARVHRNRWRGCIRARRAGDSSEEAARRRAKVAVACRKDTQCGGEGGGEGGRAHDLGGSRKTLPTTSWQQKKIRASVLLDLNLSYFLLMCDEAPRARIIHRLPGDTFRPSPNFYS
jgi:hypothetical protein